MACSFVLLEGAGPALGERSQPVVRRSGIPHQRCGDRLESVCRRSATPATTDAARSFMTRSLRCHPRPSLGGRRRCHDDRAAGRQLPGPVSSSPKDTCRSRGTRSLRHPHDCHSRVTSKRSARRSFAARYFDERESDPNDDVDHR
jgi:hypothetical protein